jgi:hypothetical protein
MKFVRYYSILKGEKYCQERALSMPFLDSIGLTVLFGKYFRQGPETGRNFLRFVFG